MAIDGQELVKPVLTEAEEKMSSATAHLKNELERLRAGKASMHTLDPVKVNNFGSLVPINQVASVSIPEPRLIVITPWNKGVIKEIEKGIINANLGLNPSSDGNVVRVLIPALTEETRKQLVKQLKADAEQAKVAVRNARHDANERLDKLCKENSLSEDRRDNEKITVQDLTDKYNKEIERIFKEKEKEVMTV